MSVEHWLKDLDSGLSMYATFWKDLSFNSVKMLKFLKLKDLQQKNAVHSSCSPQAYDIKRSIESANASFKT